MLASLALLLTGCDQVGWCERFNLACELATGEERDPIVDSDGDVWPDSEDCAPADPTSHPSAEEVCDDVDNNCDGVVDEGTPGMQDWYPDEDGDTYGDEDAAPVRSCVQPSGYVLDDSDCADNYYYQNPSRSEICENGLDDDCDGQALGCHLLGVLSDQDSAVEVRTRADGDELGAGLAVLAAGTTGRRDLVLGAPGHRDETGSIYGFLGTGALVSSPRERTVDQASYALAGATPGDRFGAAIAGVVPLGTGTQPTLAVGAPGRSVAGEPGAGAVLLLQQPLSAGIELRPTHLFASIEGGAADQALGAALATSAAAAEGDVGGLAVGVPGAGEVAVFLAPVEGTQERGDADLRLQGSDEAAGLGEALLWTDLDGDGVDDLVLSAPDQAEGWTWVHFGPLPGGIGAAEEAPASFHGEGAGDRAGAALAGGADLDGDGVGDLVLGGPGFDGEAEDVGAAWVLRGGRDVARATGAASLAQAAARIEGVVAGGAVGVAIAFDGDGDEDGDADLLLGAPDVDLDEGGEGAVYLVSGGILASRQLNTATAVIEGSVPGGALGSGVAWLGDPDANGVDDLALAAPWAEGGRIHLYSPAPQ